MRKLVPESIEESLQYKNSNVLSEGRIGDLYGKAKGLIKSSLKKVGNLFVAFYRNTPLQAILPINIGIAYDKGKLGRFINYVPSDEDIELYPSLGKYKGGKAIFYRVQKQYQEDAAKNKARGKLKESVAARKIRSKLNEAKVGLAYSGQDKIRNVSSQFLIKRLRMQVIDPMLTPPLIWGAPGIGKTAITKAVVESLGPGHRCIDVQTSKMAPDDWTLPSIYRVQAEGGKELTKAMDIPKNWLPVYVPDPDNPEINDQRNDAANLGEGGIIFLDELSRAIPEVQNSCLKLVDERIIGDSVLGSKWAIVAATNREEDDPEGGQSKIGSALANRFQHWNFVPSVDEWINWAKGKKIDPRITDFVDFNRDHFYFFDNETTINTTPRSWEALSKMLAACQDYGDIVWSRADMENLIAGSINSATVEAFMAFLTLLEKWRPEQIKLLFTDPKNSPQPTKRGEGFDIPQANALIGAACSVSRSMEPLKAVELENYVQYWINLGNPSLAAKALWLIVETHPYIHQETGDIKGKEKYKPAMDMFRKAFGGIKFGSREDVMGG